MSELAELYLVFAIIYALECAEIVPRRAVGLSPLLGRWRARRTVAPNANWRRGLLFGEPWPPLAPALVTEPLPLVIGPDGICPRGPDDAAAAGGTHSLAPARFVPWEQVRSVVALGSRLVVNGEAVALLATRRGAQAMAAAFEGLRGLPRPERLVRLARWLDARFDRATAAERLPLMLRETRPLRIAASVLWTSLLVGLPVLLWTPLAHLVLPLGAIVIGAWLTAALLFRRVLRRSKWLRRELWPDLTKRVTAVSSPVATIRAADHIARELCGDLEPIAVAAAVLPERGLRALGRSLLCDLRYGGPDEVPVGAAEDARWVRAETLTRVERVLRARGVQPETLIVPPAREDPEAAAWCPRCSSQYRHGGQDAPPVRCANEPCRGTTLCAFP